VTWLALVLLAAGASATAAPVIVDLQTDLGKIVIEVDVARAPITAANFLQYVDEGRYDGGRFHRTVRLDNQPGKTVFIEVIQAGVRTDMVPADHAPIPLERTSKTGLRHRDGTVSMARDGADTATSDFFICIGDQPSLDFGGKRNPDGQGFGAFGRVLEGMDTVRKIQAAPADGQGLTPPVRILKASRRP
jgi:peptidyl-prolyl cis-trans isomerase A (cyclophilin A)